MNMSIRIESVLEPALRDSPDAALVISEDAAMINSGLFLLRNSPAGRQFLDQVMDLLSAPLPHSFQHNQWHEQSPLMYLALIPSILQGLNMDVEDTYDDAGYHQLVALVPQKALNAYPNETANRVSILQHAEYEEGDFIISFNGCGSLVGIVRCEELLKYHHDNSLRGVV
mmetsp:Transcript_33370/g.86650  ORF Transcript_33370/g.86650 Transcript_33370/m.86650 type:complete len:170 (-) Transcript_33370:396-905(-)